MQQVRDIQASIDANKLLANQLARDGVNIRDIVNAEQAADGSVTFYVR
jgi:hypothetical protein